MHITTINGKAVLRNGKALSLKGADPVTPSFFDVKWVSTAYGIGDNTENKYNAWSPNCLHYDASIGRVLFLQCHREAHTGTFTASNLWSINPFNLLDCVKICDFQPVSNSVPLAFEIYNGNYYVMSKSRLYVSTDKGQNWTTTNISLPLAYGLYIIDGIFYVGDDAMADGHEGIYYTSTDNGLTWQTNQFDFADQYGSTINCSEATFVKHNGKLYAGIRRTGLNGLLAVYDNGAWSVVSESLPNVNSDCVMYSVEDKLVFCAIDRLNRHLHLGTIEVEPFTITTNKEIDFSNDTQSGDFHTPSLAFGTGFEMVSMMITADFQEYNNAMNIAIVGYDDLSRNQTPIDYQLISKSYSTTAINEKAVKASPYIGTAPVISDAGKVTQITKDSIYDASRLCYGSGAFDEEGYFCTFNAVGNLRYISAGTTNVGGKQWYYRDGYVYYCGQGAKLPAYPVVTKAKAYRRDVQNTDGLSFENPWYADGALVPYLWATYEIDFISR